MADMHSERMSINGVLSKAQHKLRCDWVCTYGERLHEAVNEEVESAGRTRGPRHRRLGETKRRHTVTERTVNDSSQYMSK